MSKWESVVLGDISTIRTGYVVREKLPEDRRGSMGILQMKDVQPEGINWGGLSRINPVGHRQAFFLRPEDVVFCGRGTKIFAKPVLISPENVVAGQQFFVVSPHEGIPAEYVAWHINSGSGQRYFWKYAGGSSIINVTRNVLVNCPMHLPSQSELNTFTEIIRSAEREWQVCMQLRNRRQDLLEGILDKGMEGI